MIFLGIDIGASKIECKLKNKVGVKEYRFDFLVSDDFESEVCKIGKYFLRIRDDIPSNEKLVVVVSSAPKLDESGVVLEWPNKKRWVGLSLSSLFSFNGDCSIKYIDDGQAACVAESFYYKVDNVLSLVIGSGVGGGIIQNGELIPELKGHTLGLGHISVTFGDRYCVCGGKNCLQSYVGGFSILNRGHELGLLVNSITQLSSSVIRKNSIATLIYKDMLDALYEVVNYLSKSYYLEYVVLSGGVLQGLPILFDDVKEKLLSSLGKEEAFPKVTISKYKNASLEGAFLLTGERLDVQKTSN